eukprot:CAMPEP_0176468904 /NCGR_PEP_ID=MMETSP0127-20121128/39421_1 /TAXON_ID=938130 /ORGANISM="Platyophrya macrostoma, Strain WH" /LENGTH=1177 /DNA_ID=CAMNT_0017862663 /DNA_START=106 /DNA_END=3639 /DNA_ORIENTATION=+
MDSLGFFDVPPDIPSVGVSGGNRNHDRPQPAASSSKASGSGARGGGPRGAAARPSAGEDVSEIVASSRASSKLSTMDTEDTRSTLAASDVSVASTDDVVPPNHHRHVHRANRRLAHDDDDDFDVASDEDDEDVFEEADAQNEALPEHACNYCGYHHDPLACAMCTQCNRWFCNGRGQTSGSHIITHMVLAKHTSLTLHPDSPLGDAPLECYVCGMKNIFSLGFVPSKEESVVVIICREPCLHSQTLRDMEWDPSAWLPLIEEKRLLSWICPVPSSSDTIATRGLSNHSARELEALWRVKPTATINDFLRGERAETIRRETGVAGGGGESGVALLPSIPFNFSDGNHYRDHLSLFVANECDASRELTDSMHFPNLSITWNMGLQRRRVGVVSLPPDAGKITVGDEVILYSGALAAASSPPTSSPAPATSMPSTSSAAAAVAAVAAAATASSSNHHGSGWQLSGVVVRMESLANTSDEIHIELKEHQHDSVSDSQIVSVTSVMLKMVFKPVNFDRQRVALRLFATDEASVSAYLYHAILGHTEGSAGGRGSRFTDVVIPDDINAPHIAKLNSSQSAAIRAALTRPLSLIQGPPGTGKTTTSATLVYHMCDIHNSQVLVCSPSNVAVDQLASRIEATGLTVVRLYARSRETISSTADHLALHNQVRQFAASSPEYSELNKLFRLKTEMGVLSDKDQRRFVQLVREVESNLLMNADVVCCTCSGAGDQRLSKFSFRYVLIDESTQATEPEVLIPIVMGAKQIVLVGDHCQMGPVIVCKPAEEAGYGRSLFERLLQLGHRPFRLEIQYRMHPALSEFSSNSFYEGTLQNGVTAKDRDASALFPWPNPSKPLFFYNTIHPEEISGSGTSYLNRTEAALAEKMATLLLRNGVLPDQIGIITPYVGQRNYLVQYLARQGPLGPEVYRRLEVASVDSFQGREKEFIILTCVRSNDQQGIGFLADWRRLNVALTRARRGVMIIGNARVLSKHPLWHSLLTHFKEQGLIVEGAVQSLVPVKVALQKPRLTAQAIGPRSTFGLQAMYQGGLFGVMDDRMASMMAGNPALGAASGFAAQTATRSVSGSMMSSYLPSSMRMAPYQERDDSTESVVSSSLESSGDVIAAAPLGGGYLPGEAPATRYTSESAKTNSHALPAYSPYQPYSDTSASLLGMTSGYGWQGDSMGWGM